MREWWYGNALINGLDEVLIGTDETPTSTHALVRSDCGWT